MTITLDLPEDLAAALSDVPEADRNRYAVALMRAGWWQSEDDGAEEEEGQTPLSQAELDSIGRGLAEADAGKGLPGESVLAELRQIVSATRRRVEA